MVIRWNCLIFKDLCKFFKLWLLIYGAKNEPFKASFRKNPKNHEFGKIPQKPLFCWFSGFSPFYPKIPLFLTPLKIPPKIPLFLTPSEIPLKCSFRKTTIFSENLKNVIFQKTRFFTFLGKPDISGFFIFCKKRYFLCFCYFCHFPHFRKNEEMLDFCVFWYFHKMSIFIKYRFFTLLWKREDFEICGI